MVKLFLISEEFSKLSFSETKALTAIGRVSDCLVTTNSLTLASQLIGNTDYSSLGDSL